MLPSVSRNVDVGTNASQALNTGLAWNTGRGSGIFVLRDAGGFYSRKYGKYIAILCVQQEVFRSKKKRDRKGRHGGDAGLDDDRLEAELSLIRRPQISDTLPCVVFRFAVRVAVAIPSSVRLVIEWYHDWRTAEDQTQDEEPGCAACSWSYSCSP